ncbi:hypothetical protein HGRIS_008843 [Hohenbuehelia grisea]|uniref:Uncharacterized protein n=1 Tax=Hohenbuehelia grisea TaxID=104357 RepID=A0ABR3IZC1_9AGAR
MILDLVMAHTALLIQTVDNNPPLFPAPVVSDLLPVKDILASGVSAICIPVYLLIDA